MTCFFSTLAARMLGFKKAGPSELKIKGINRYLNSELLNMPT